MPILYESTDDLMRRGKSLELSRGNVLAIAIGAGIIVVAVGAVVGIREMAKEPKTK